MKTIIIKDFNIWQRTERPSTLIVERAYYNGYFNVFIYNNELEQFLKNNDILYTVSIK